MKKIIFSLFILLILSNQYASSQNRPFSFKDIPLLLENWQDTFQGSWSLDGDKLNLELYSTIYNFSFCSLNLYDDKNRKFNEIIGGDLNIDVKRTTIVKKIIYLPHFYKEIRKAKSLTLKPCDGPELPLVREKGVVNKSLDKIFGR
jgi:hypothetical protein